MSHEPSRSTVVRHLRKQPHVESRNGHDIVSEECEAASEAEEVEAFTPAGDNFAFITIVFHEAPGFIEGEHGHDIGGKFSVILLAWRDQDCQVGSLTLLYLRG